MKLGRKARRYDPRVPHLSSFLAGRRRLLAPPPPTIDYITPCGSSFGMMRNDDLGDCTCAAIGHARQIWTGNANPPMQTDSDYNIVWLYSHACGYVDGDPSTDQGGNEQSVLTYMLNNGLPVDNSFDKLLGFVEVDPSNLDDVKNTIVDCGVCYIGFNVPDYFMQTVGQLWDVRPGTPKYIGGHAVVLAAYDAVGPTCITWGAPQKMTWAAFQQCTDEAYALADADWITNTGKTPGGMTLVELEAAMSALKEAA
jgi:hypothetical protein